MIRVAQLLSNFRFLPGPIIAVEMVTTARRKWHYVVRFLYASALLFAVISHNPDLYASTRYGQKVTLEVMAGALHSFFVWFGNMQILAVLFVGPAMAAGTIASERERRTIEYLFTSTLNDSEIILGKLVARLLSILYLILAGVPVLAATMLLGGIAPQSLAVLFVITCSTAAFVAVLSVCISAFSRRARDAVVKAYLVLFVFSAIVPFVSSTSTAIGASPVCRFLMDAHPVVVFAQFFAAFVPVAGNAVWTATFRLVQNQAIMAALMLVFSTLMMRRVHLRQSGGVGRRRWRWRWFAVPLGNRPMLWKELWAEPAARLGITGYSAAAIVYATVLITTFYIFYDAFSRTYRSSTPANRYQIKQDIWLACMLATAVGCLGTLLIGARAACGVTSEKERDCWDSLISTPLEAREIIFAKIMGSVWTMRGVLPLLLAVWLPSIVLAPNTTFAAPLSFLTLTIVAVFVAALGTRLSLGAKTSMRAMAATVGIAVFCGGGYLFCCSPCMFILVRPGWGGEEAVVLVVSACVPFLVAIPTEFSFQDFWRASPDAMPGLVLLAYLAGNFIYGVAAAVLYASAVEQFDRVSGRSHPKYFFERRPAEKVQAPMPASKTVDPASAADNPTSPPAE